MKDILKVMWFDLLTSANLAVPAMLVFLLVCGVGALFFSPLMAGFLAFGSMLFVIPLQSAAERSGFHKLYGLLPVKRKQITRGRFAFMFAAFFGTELIGILIARIAPFLALYRLLPNQGSPNLVLIAKTFEDVQTSVMAIILMHFLMSLVFIYMEMMGQIFGRENEMKIIMISLTVLTVVLITFFTLSDHEIIPRINFGFDEFQNAGNLFQLVSTGLIFLVLTIVFGEITAHVVSRREL